MHIDFHSTFLYSPTLIININYSITPGIPKFEVIKIQLINIPKFVYFTYIHGLHNCYTISGYTDTLATGFEGTNTNAGEIMLGFYSAMWSYDGWYVSL